MTPVFYSMNVYNEVFVDKPINLVLILPTAVQLVLLKKEQTNPSKSPRQAHKNTEKDSSSHPHSCFTGKKEK